MIFGVCGGPALSGVARASGFAYIEDSVGSRLKPREDESAFRDALKHLPADTLPCPALNGFVPADLKITGPDVSMPALKAFATTVFERAQATGVKTIVFGSGGARRVPEGFDPRRAHGQLVAFCSMLAPLAFDRGITVVVEPLNRAECNVLTTVRESAELVREVGHAAVRLLVDGYHLLKDGDSLEDVVAHGELLAHVHVATVPGRLAPGAEDCDLGPFFRSLVRAGYKGRVSIEGKLDPAAQSLPRAIALMNALAGT